MLFIEKQRINGAPRTLVTKFFAFQNIKEVISTRFTLIKIYRKCLDSVLKETIWRMKMSRNFQNVKQNPLAHSPNTNESEIESFQLRFEYSKPRGLVLKNVVTLSSTVLTLTCCRL